MMAEHRTIRTWRRRAAWAAAAATALAVAILAPAHAQSQRGTIAGQVVDTDGAPLPGVIAVAINPEATPTEPPRFAVTDRQGRYRIRGLQAGTWSVTFSLPGFGSAVRNDVEVQGSSTRVVDSELARRAWTPTFRSPSVRRGGPSARRAARLPSSARTGPPASSATAAALSSCRGSTHRRRRERRATLAAAALARLRPEPSPQGFRVSATPIGTARSRCGCRLPPDQPVPPSARLVAGGRAASASQAPEPTNRRPAPLGRPTNPPGSRAASVSQTLS